MGLVGENNDLKDKNDELTADLSRTHKAIEHASDGAELLRQIQDLSGALGQVTRERKRLEGEMKVVRESAPKTSKFDTLNAEITGLNAELAASAEKNAALTVENAILAERLLILTEEHGELTVTYEALTVAFKLLQEELDTGRQKNADSLELVKQQHADELETARQKHAVEMEATKQNHAIEMETVRQELAVAAAENAGATMELRNYIKELAEKQKDMEATLAHLNAVKQQVDVKHLDELQTLEAQKHREQELRTTAEDLFEKREEDTLRTVEQYRQAMTGDQLRFEQEVSKMREAQEEVAIEQERERAEERELQREMSTLDKKKLQVVVEKLEKLQILQGQQETQLLAKTELLAAYAQDNDMFQSRDVEMTQRHSKVVQGEAAEVKQIKQAAQVSLDEVQKELSAFKRAQKFTAYELKGAQQDFLSLQDTMGTVTDELKTAVATLEMERAESTRLGQEIEVFTAEKIRKEAEEAGERQEKAQAAREAIEEAREAVQVAEAARCVAEDAQKAAEKKPSISEIACQTDALPETAQSQRRLLSMLLTTDVSPQAPPPQLSQEQALLPRQHPPRQVPSPPRRQLANAQVQSPSPRQTPLHQPSPPPQPHHRSLPSSAAETASPARSSPPRIPATPFRDSSRSPPGWTEDTSETMAPISIAPPTLAQSLTVKPVLDKVSSNPIAANFDVDDEKEPALSTERSSYKSPYLDTKTYKRMLGSTRSTGNERPMMLRELTAFKHAMQYAQKRDRVGHDVYEFVEPEKRKTMTTLPLGQKRIEWDLEERGSSRRNMQQPTRKLPPGDPRAIPENVHGVMLNAKYLSSLETSGYARTYLSSIYSNLQK
jgi:hypothetical protein